MSSSTTTPAIPSLIQIMAIQLQAATADITTRNSRSTILNPDPLDSTISIDNSGSIAFSGLRGIKANNPSGESITITNSGDITSTQDTCDSDRHLCLDGIASRNDHRSTLIEPGDFTRNAYGQLTGVIARNEITVDQPHGGHGGTTPAPSTSTTPVTSTWAPSQAYAGYGVMASVGIYTRGDGGTTIVNDGDITVGEFSAGILTFSTATTSITNSGRIEVGNSSAGIFFEESAGRWPAPIAWAATSTS